MIAAPELSSPEVVELFQKYVIGNYTRYPACVVRGEGSEMWDAEGNRYLDFFPGWGCNLLGHCPPAVVRAVQDQVEQLIHVPNTWYMQDQGLFAKALVERAFDSRVFFCNSGAEANEAAIKLARATMLPRYRIITAENSFHGRTFGAVSATGQPKYQSGFGPLVPGFRHAPFGDLDAFAALVDDETAAIMVEPIQGEGGVRTPPKGFLEGLRSLCDRHGILLILDEVQTGMGRTGRWFAHQHFGVEPDLMTLAKALGSGIAVGAMLAKPDVAKNLKPGMHASTFGGNPIACRAGLATVETIEDDDLLARASAIADRFRDFFESQRTPGSLIREIRCFGAMIGVELDVPAAPFVKAAMERRLLINATNERVIRLLPALTITDAQIDEGCAILKSVLEEASA
jgi:predicted acetylornithine/succinylornithine family transaminase